VLSHKKLNVKSGALTQKPNYQTTKLPNYQTYVNSLELGTTPKFTTIDISNDA
jgi:hypothetical protein